MRAWLLPPLVLACSNAPSKLDGVGERTAAGGTAGSGLSGGGTAAGGTSGGGLSGSGLSGSGLSGSGLSGSGLSGSGTSAGGTSGAGTSAGGTSAGGTSAARPPRPVRPPPPDDPDLDRELDRTLREVTARPGDGKELTRGAPLDEAALGPRPGPVGPLAALRPRMTRAEIRRTIPAVVPDGELLWVATGLEGVSAELLFDRNGLLAQVVYRLPPSARAIVERAWGPTPPAGTGWLDREHTWRIDLTEERRGRVLALTMSGFAPFAALIGSGPDGLAETAPIVGAPRAVLEERYGARLHATGPAAAVLAMPGPATDLCAGPSELQLAFDPRGTATEAVLVACYGDDERRRAGVAAMERQWGGATARRTADDRAVLVWTRRGRALELEQGGGRFRVAIRMP